MYVVFELLYSVHMSIFCLFNSTGRFLTTFLRLKKRQNHLTKLDQFCFFGPGKVRKSGYLGINDTLL